MGLFDTVRSSFDLGPGYHRTLQTKDLECLMCEYWIDSAGKLYEIDYSHTADFVEIGPDDPNYNQERGYLNFFWKPNGTKGKVSPVYHTGVVEVYPESMGEWTLYAEVAADGIYTESAVSLPKSFDVGDPTLVYRLNDFKQNMFKTPYVYGVGTFLGASIGGGLVLARRRGLLKNPFNRGEVVEKEPIDLKVDEEDEDDFDF